MATLLHTESRRLYSWWWDSHISPKNSKWLQENLTDMDSKVKAMIKLIEEDADSFARRAEMYYKKRPELMKLVEDFYRAYRALAERYDHATGALRQAQRTMAEAFPNQIPFVLTDESPSPSGTEMEPHTPEMAAPVRVLFDSDDIPRDPLVVSPHFHVIKRKGAYSEENDALTSRKGLKQLNELIATGEGEACANFTEGRAKKVLNFREGEGKNSEDKAQYWPRNLPNQESIEEDLRNEARYSEELSRLSTENQNLKSQIASESERADKAESEVQSLKDSLSKLNSEMEASISKFQQSIERISYLETQISHTQDDFKKLNDETVVRSMKLGSAEERCLLLEKANQSLQSVLNTMEQKSKTQQEELSKKQEELENLNISIQAEHQRCTEAEMALLSMEKLHSQSREESKLLAMEIERGINNLKDMELRNAGLEEEMCQLREENGSLNEQELSSSLKIKNLQHEISMLEETRGKLEYEMGIYLEEKKVCQHELDFLKKDTNDLAIKYQGLMEEMDAVRLNAESLRAFAKELQDRNIELKEICKKHEDEKLLLLENVKNMENFQEKNAVLENSLSGANAEVEWLKEKTKTLEGSCESLYGQIISHISEKAVLVSQVETTAQNMEKLTEKNGFLENSLSDMNVDLEGLRGKLKDIEESYQSLYDQKTSLLAENNTLVSQVESIGQSLENLESRHADLQREKDLTLHQLMELEGFLKLEKQENETLTQSSKSQLATLENQICLLREESRVREEEFEVEQHKVTSALVEIFILQRCLSDMKEKSSILSNDCHKHLEGSKCAEELISKLEQENLIQKKKMTLLFEHNEKLRQGILRLLRVLNINKEFGSSDGVNDEVLLQIIFAEIKKLLNSISDAQDGILHVQLETLVAVTILNQIGDDVKDKNDLEQRHQALREEMEIVSLNAESLRSLVKELQDGNVEMKEICKKHEDEKLLLLQKLKNMEKILEKNTVLENSLSDVNVELEGLREKIKTSEGSCESLHGQVITHISEKAVLVSQVEINAQNIEKLMEKNALLENSLSDMNAELEGLREKLKDLEESYQSLCGEKANLLSENTTLVSQVESFSRSLENMESRHVELEDKHLRLERERDSTLHQIMELEVFLKQEKQEHETLTQSCKSQLASLNNQIRILREESRVREEEFEVEQNKITSAIIEIFILQRCLSDMSETNLNLSKDYLKHLEVSRCAENLVSQLEQEDILQKKKIMSLSEHNEKLRQGILLLFRALCINKEFGSTDGVKDEVLLKIIPHEIRNLLNSFSDAQDEIQHLQVEMLVVVTNLKQIGLDVEDLRTEKVLLERELEIQKEELSISQSKNQKTLELNEHLRQDIQIEGQLVEELKAEMETLHLQLTDLQQAHSRSQSEIRKLLDENQSLSEKIYNLRKEKGALEEENSAVIVEAMALEHLYLLSRSSNAERALVLKLCIDGMDNVHAVKNKLDEEIGVLDEKLSVLEVENMHLKESAACLEEYSNRSIFLEFDLNTTRYVCEELNHEIEAGKNRLGQKEMELSEANQKVQSLQDMNGELSKNLAGLNQDVDGAKVVREEIEGKVFSLSIEVEVLRSREEHLTSNLQKEKYEVEQCGMDIMALLNDAHVSMVSAAIFEEKVFELMLACEGLEIFAMVQKEMLNEEIASRNVFITGLKKNLYDMEGENRALKTNLNAYLPLILSLWGSIASLKEKTISLAGLHASNDQDKQDNSLVSHHQHDKSSTLREDHSTVVPLGFLELQKLIAKVELLEKVITDTGSFLEQERSDAIANSESARKEIEGLKVKLIEGEPGEEPGTNHKLQNDDTEITKTKYEQTTKDIQLDEVSSSSPYENNVGSYGLPRIESSETDDQMLELWEAAERDCNTGVQNMAPGALEHDIEAVEEGKREHPSSELVAEKTLSITEIEKSHQELNRRVLESCASDSRKLSVLQTSVQELQRRMACSEKSKRPKSLEFDTVKTKLEEAEGAILELIDLNGKLAENAEERHVSSDGMSRAQEEIGSTGWRQISERVRRGSEKIGMLELELQKIQYILLKLEEEHENTRNRASDRSPKVLLREYLNVRRDKLRRKKGSLCGCMRPKTTGD